MPEKLMQLKDITGLSFQEIASLQKRFGKNLFQRKHAAPFVHIVYDIVREPMFILLVIACSLYFTLGEFREGIMMIVAIIFVAGVSLYQEARSSAALHALQQLTAPRVRVIRDGEEMLIDNRELVPGDIMLLDEGMHIPADAIILHGNDLTINESVVTGESIPVNKNEFAGFNKLYQGTTINSGRCVAQVTATGNNTVLGKLGKLVDEYHSPQTLLQKQVNGFVRKLALFGLLGFVVIFLVNYLNHYQWANSLLLALTLAMSAVPEEIPVAFSSFMALGAYRMSKLGIISRQPHIIENLGAVTVICLDKTGTITENKMVVKTIYDHEKNILTDLLPKSITEDSDVLIYAALASESDPFDAMEQAIWEASELHVKQTDLLQLKMIHEYPLEGQPPMMTHVYAYGLQKLIAGKGGVEHVMQVCRLSNEEKQNVLKHARSLASSGYRVIGVAGTIHAGSELPDSQDGFNWCFKGLLALYDPPKKNIPGVIAGFYHAGINVKLVTGDFPETAMNIATQVGISTNNGYMTGEQVMAASVHELKNAIKSINIFVRMYPDAKLKLIEALKSNNEIVVMTGDGVNDGPALKSASIGIAMGKKGTVIARKAADLVLTDDNLERMISAIQEGRKILSNLRKAIRYIISIHIPIILTASLPVLLGWIYPNIFAPIHVIFMELIMGPTCSIFFEREPVEEAIMRQHPRNRNYGLFTREEFMISIVQGCIITLGLLILYYYFMKSGYSLEHVRTIVFTTLLLSNVFLTFVNRSFTRTMYYTSRYKNELVPVIVAVSVLFLGALHFVPYLTHLFGLTALTSGQFWLCLGVAFACTMWFEAYKTNLSDNIHPAG